MATLEQSITSLRGPLQGLIETYLQKKRELAHLEQRVTSQEEVIGLYDSNWKRLQDERKQAILNKLECIREVGTVDVSRFTPDNIIEHQDEILTIYERVAGDGLGRMSLFLRTEKDQPNVLQVDPKKITLQSSSTNENVVISNPFKFVYAERDAKGSPNGFANFEQFLGGQFAENFRTNDCSFYLAYGPSGAGKTTLTMLLLTHLLESYAGHCTVENRKLYPLVTADGKVTFRNYSWREKRAEDVTKIVLNKVELIHKVGVSLHQYSRDLFRIVQNFTYHPSFSDVDTYVKVNNGAYELNLKLFDDAYRGRFGQGMVNHAERLKLVQDTISLCNNTRETLRRLVAERLTYEMESFPFHTNRQEFLETGGFIPFFWLLYATRTTCFKLSYFSDLGQCNFPVLVYEDYYRRMTKHIKLTRQFEDNIARVVAEYLTSVDLKDRSDYVENMIFFILSQNGVCPKSNEQYREMFAYKGVTLTFKHFNEVNEGIKRGQPNVDSENDSFVFSDTGVVTKPVAVERPEQVAGLLEMAKQSSFTRSTQQNLSSSRTADLYEITCEVEGKRKKVILIDLPGNEEQIRDCTRENKSQRCAETRGIHVLLHFVRRLIAVKRYGFASAEGKTLLGINSPNDPLNIFFGRMLDNEVTVSFLCFAANFVSGPNYMPNTKITLHYVDDLFRAKLECNKAKKREQAAQLLENMDTEHPAAAHATTQQGEWVVSKIQEVTDVDLGLPELPSKRETLYVKTDANGSYLAIEGTHVTQASLSTGITEHWTLQNVNEIVYYGKGNPETDLFTYLKLPSLSVLKKSNASLVPFVYRGNSTLADVIQSPIAVDFSTSNDAVVPSFTTKKQEYAGKVFTNDIQSSSPEKPICHVYLMTVEEMKKYQDTSLTLKSDLLQRWTSYKPIITKIKPGSGGSLTKKVKRRAAKSKTRSSK